ncbi:hypothetical protein HNR23_001461 [Nocardiopsis mwathae]|uniref:Uncharacterized protein n=1 Tax=Nocardiopsis mwathae TaxID=1472723 RepID=A0A7W9YHP3_9ACTN|nr:glycoside hydrolase [Nocardiopsis mwathae]MBB6171401.1 hypothetical protein [Nocardiopsis mwathae]
MAEEPHEHRATSAAPPPAATDSARPPRPRPGRLLAGIAACVGVGVAVPLAVAAAAQPAAAPVRVEDGSVIVPIRGGDAVVDTATLAVTARPDTDGGPRTLSESAEQDLGEPGDVAVDGDGAHWSYPDLGLEATATAEQGRLAVELRSTAEAAADTTLTWPVTGTDPAASAVDFPRGEGLSVPLDDDFWNSEDAGLAGTDIDMSSGLTMPFWGIDLGGLGAAYSVGDDGIGTLLRFVSDGGRLSNEAEHTFSGASGTLDYAVTIALTGAEPTAAAADYRSLLKERGRLGSLRAKIAANPEVQKLIGAFHAYTWGAGSRAEGIARMRELGIGRMWLGYDPESAPMDAEAVGAADDAGYLVGPYDSWANAQDPADSDTALSVWPDGVYPRDCVIEADGTPKTGFGGRGCYLSSQAVADGDELRESIAERVRDLTANGATGYFLDVDAAGELFDDHSPDHPMTQARDRDNRIERMRGLTEDDGLVLGSESAVGWANEVIAFDHGSSTPVADGLWAAQRDRESWGAWAPASGPKFFFKPATLPEPVATAMFDPAYRVPLYQTVLHDSVIGTDRWELPLYKLPDRKRDRVLLAMLYNTPINLVLNDDELDAHGEEIAELQNYFQPLHEAAATEPMTGFAYLSDDHLVQRTGFGDGALTVTANFGDAADPGTGLPGGCVEASVDGGAPRRLCPEAA